MFEAKKRLILVMVLAVVLTVVLTATVGWVLFWNPSESTSVVSVVSGQTNRYTWVAGNLDVGYNVECEVNGYGVGHCIVSNFGDAPLTNMPISVQFHNNRTGTSNKTISVDTRFRSGEIPPRMAMTMPLNIPELHRYCEHPLWRWERYCKVSFLVGEYSYPDNCEYVDMD